MKTERLYDPESRRIDSAIFDRPRIVKTEAPAMDAQAARRRLRKEPVATWRESVEKFTARTEAAAAKVRECQAAFDAETQAVARGTDGAEEKQAELHDALVRGRGAHEKASAALEVARAQLAESEKAAEIVRRADSEKKRAAEHVAAKAAARAAVARHEKALEELRAADQELRTAVAAAVSFEPPRESWQERFDQNTRCEFCTAGRACSLSRGCRSNTISSEMVSRTTRPPRAASGRSFRLSPSLSPITSTNRN